MGVPVRVWPRAPKIIMIKFHFTFDTTKKAQNLKNKLLVKYKNNTPNFADIIIVGGGDGFMLNSLKRYAKYKKPFYGINCGSFGFLMNKFIDKNIEKKISLSKKVLIKPLVIHVKNKKSTLAINEVSLFRQGRQTAALNLRVGKKEVIKKLIGDGILVSTPAGSTAYNLSVNGPVLSLSSNKLAVTPISPFRPRRWRGKLISNKQEIKITNLDPVKRPVAAVADNIEIRNVKSINIKISKKIIFCLMYEKSRSLVKRIKLEQNRQKI